MSGEDLSKSMVLTRFSMQLSKLQQNLKRKEALPQHDMVPDQARVTAEKVERRFRLLFVAHSMQVGGAERTLYNIMKYLNCKLFEPYLAAPNGPLLESFRPFCQTVVILTPGYLPLAFRPFAYMRSAYATVINFYKLWRFMRRCPVDLVFTNTGVIIHGVLAARIFQIPSAIMMHEIISPAMLRTALFRLFLRLNDRVIVISQAVIKACGAIGRPPRVVKISGAIDLNGCGDTHPTANPAVCTLPNGEPLVGLVGLVHPLKGHEHFLHMAAEVAQKIRQVKFVVVGKYSTRSRYYKYLVRLRHQLGLDDRVVFTGVVEPIHAVMERLHLLVVSSNTESLGLVILEAMALGKPVVAFRVGGIPEVVEDGVTGRLVKFGDCHAMAGAVASLLEDPKMSACMGAAGRARVEKDFNVFIQSEQIEATLLNVLTG